MPIPVQKAIGEQMDGREDHATEIHSLVITGSVPATSGLTERGDRS